MAPAEPLPLGTYDREADVGGDGAAGDDQHGAALPGPGGQAAGVTGADVRRRAEEDDVDGFEQGGDDRRPVGAGTGDQWKAIEGHAA